MKNTEKLNKRDRLINTLIVIAVIGGVLAVRYLPPAIAYWRSSEVYKRYSKVEGVRATYIKDFRVNDTVTVGVTLLEATDSAGWEYLINKFNISQEIIEETAIDVWTRKCLRNHPEIIYNSKDSNCQEGFEVVAMSMKKQAICVLHTRNEQEWDAVFDNRIEANL